MMDEGVLRERFPEIPWDQPQRVYVMKPTGAVGDPADPPGYLSVWVCRYCIALYGVKASDLLDHRIPFAFQGRQHALDHVEAEHHD